VLRRVKTCWWLRCRLSVLGMVDAVEWRMCLEGDGSMLCRGLGHRGSTIRCARGAGVGRVW